MRTKLTKQDVIEALEACQKDDKQACKEKCKYNVNGFNCHRYMHRDALKYLKEEKKE